MKSLTKKQEKAIDTCYKLAAKLHNAFDRETLDRLYCIAYDNGINVYSDYETYVMVEDEMFEVLMF